MPLFSIFPTSSFALHASHFKYRKDIEIGLELRAITNKSMCHIANVIRDRILSLLLFFLPVNNEGVTDQAVSMSFDPTPLFALISS